jgi:hypothetical protein
LCKKNAYLEPVCTCNRTRRTRELATGLQRLPNSRVAATKDQGYE